MKKQEYRYTFKGQDLSDRDFSKQNLNNTNFADTILTMQTSKEQVSRTASSIGQN